MLKWTVRGGNPCPLGSCTPEFYRKRVDLGLSSFDDDGTKSEGYLSDPGEEEDEVDSYSWCGEDRNNNNSSIEGLDLKGIRDNKFKSGFVRGSDPLLQTARGKLQNKRSKLNAQINRELKLRTGAENLYKATSNKRLRENITLELRVVNSNLQLLKEELAELNNSVEIYQNECSSGSSTSPLIPLGLKETNDISLELPVLHFLKDHYGEDPALYTRQLATFMELRQASRTPTRNAEGIELLFTYYNHLYFIDKRFFPPDTGLGVFFEWYDSLTGVPCSQKTVGFEKGAILFNIGALFSQIAVKQDRNTDEGLQVAIESLQKSAGAYRYLQENFSNAPSMDMQNGTLDMLAQLMMAQAAECTFEQRIMSDKQNGLKENIELAHEASNVSSLYENVHTLMSTDNIKDYVPYSWLLMVQVKSCYFRALSHFHAAKAVMEHCDDRDGHYDQKTVDRYFESLHVHEVKQNSAKTRGQRSVADKCPQNEEEKREFARAHLRQSILHNEDALRIHGDSKQLRKIDTFHTVLKSAHDRSLRHFSELEEEDDFTELLSAPCIAAISEQSLPVILPDFSAHKVDDLFHDLGPLSMFSAQHSWSSTRNIMMERAPGEEYGFCVRGESPIIIALVEEKSVAQKSGVKVGDFIVGVGDTNIKWQKHVEVVNLIKDAGDKLTLKLISPLDKNYLQPPPKTMKNDKPKTSASNNASSKGGTNDSPPKQSSPGQGLFKKRTNMHKKTGSGDSGSSWTLKRRGKSKDKYTVDRSDNDMVCR